MARLLVILAAALLAAAAPAGAATRTTPLETVLQDDAQFLHRSTEDVRASLARLRELGVDRLRATANWSVVTRDADSPTRPAFDASDPAAYEQARWASLDRMVRLASEAGMRVMLDVAFWAPRWASRDPEGERGRTEVDPGEFAAFATAVARRYAGGFVVPADSAPVEPNDDAELLEDFFGPATGVGGDEPPPEPSVMPLPRVDVLTLWNEPNHPGFLRPQWSPTGRGGFTARSPEIYRAMVGQAYPAVKAAVPQTTVLIGASSATGSYSRKGTGGIPPLRFLRELACVDSRLRPLRTDGCKGFERLPGDGWSHHPYSMTTTPDARARRSRPDDVPIAEIPRLVRTLGRLAAAGRIGDGLRDVWITEYGYETNPPSTLSRFGAGDQARFLPWGEFLAWRIPRVRSFAQFLLRDLPPGKERTGASVRRPFGEWYSGLEFSDGRPKLAAATFRAGLFVERRRGRDVRLWGRLRLGPGARAVEVQVRRRGGAGWEPLTTRDAAGRGATRSLTVDGAGVLDRTARAPRGSAVRYRLAYADGAATRTSPSITAVRAVKAAPKR